MRHILSTLALLLCLSQAQGADPWPQMDPAKLELRSASVLVMDTQGNAIYRKNAEQVVPIASITKLMTAMVVLDAGVALDRQVTIRKTDRDLLRLTGSRLHYDQASLTRRELLTIALMSSENRAAAALGRSTFPGGTREFVQVMNRKAGQLGMEHSRFVDATGLDAGNVSTATDLVKLLRAAGGYPLIKTATTTRSTEVHPYRKRGSLRYVNTNRLLKNDKWHIGLSKTGYINEAGRCLVMEATLYGRRLHIVLLNSFGKLTPFGDSNRLRKFIGRQLASSSS
jgi:D-alanyl-D-alanine endopeptidase (penicillin-binding protein 7)